MGFISKWLLVALAGAVCGDIATMMIAPAIIGWYNSTVDPSALCNCLTTARATARHMIEAQGIGSSIGVLLFLILGFIVTNARRKRLRAQQAAASPPAATT
jgi:uncharacterized membrane protein